MTVDPVSRFLVRKCPDGSTRQGWFLSFDRRLGKLNLGTRGPSYHGINHRLSVNFTFVPLEKNTVLVDLSENIATRKLLSALINNTI